MISAVVSARADAFRRAIDEIADAMTDAIAAGSMYHQVLTRHPMPCTHLGVIKDSSSGSTWFSEVLGSIDGVDMRHEILNSHSLASREAVLNKELETPCGTGQRLRVFTQNPHHALINWRRVGASHSSLNVALWVRTNFVATSVSELVVALPECRTHNTENRTQADVCKAARIRPSPKDFMTTVMHNVCDLANNAAVAEALSPREREPLILSYEEMQRNATSLLLKVAARVQLDPQLVLRRQGTGSTLVKRGNAHLSDTLENFDALLALLRRPPWAFADDIGCPLAEMLANSEPTVYSGCRWAKMCAEMVSLRSAFDR